MFYVNLLILSCYLAQATTDGKRQYQIQNGPCSYTFLLPEQDNCRTPSNTYSNLVQRDDPVDEDEESVQRLEQLENIMENNTQWLIKRMQLVTQHFHPVYQALDLIATQELNAGKNLMIRLALNMAVSFRQLETYIQDSMKQEMVQIQQNAVQNHTATMIEIGTNLLSQTAEQTRKLTNVEAQVINHSTRLERQLLENSLSTNKLEKQLILQTNEISKLNDKNSILEKRVGEIEEQRQLELKTLRDEKGQLQVLLQKQTAIIGQLEEQLLRASTNNSALQRQQQELLETVNSLIYTISVPASGVNKPSMMQDTPLTYMDCAAVFKSGNTDSGIYSLTLPNTTQEIKAYCDMETEGGGWTILQKRFDGRVDFHRTWNEYKAGFGDASGEHWLGNEFVSRLTNQQNYILRIQLWDWEDNFAFSQYEKFYLENEAQKYRIHLKGYSGTAGKISSLAQPGNDFSTKDADNDKCVCKCSQLTTGGWWFDACGPSNLNGIYFQQGQNSNRFNGIKWYYWKGSGYSLKSTTMMIRPTEF